MDYKDTWRDVLSPLLDRVMDDYDPKYHRTLKVLFKDKTDRIGGNVKSAQALLTESEKRFFRQLMLDDLVKQLSNANPDETAVALEWTD